MIRFYVKKKKNILVNNNNNNFYIPSDKYILMRLQIWKNEINNKKKKKKNHNNRITKIKLERETLILS